MTIEAQSLQAKNRLILPWEGLRDAVEFMTGDWDRRRMGSSSIYRLLLPDKTDANHIADDWYCDRLPTDRFTDSPKKIVP